MGNFQQITMVVAIVILIFCLAAIGVIMYYSVNESVFPPIAATCPAFFEQHRDDEGKVTCSLDGQIIPGYSTAKKCNRDFELHNSSKVERCNNRTLANLCNWSWDGITNLGNPCDDINLD
jgi:hypothetical protein